MIPAALCVADLPKLAELIVLRRFLLCETIHGEAVGIGLLKPMFAAQK